MAYVPEPADDLQSVKVSSDREPNRPKLDDGIEDQGDREMDDSDSDDSCGYDDGRYDFTRDDCSSVDYSDDETISTEENKVFRQYLKQIKKSEGFDVDIFPERVIGGLRLIDMELFSDKVIKCAEFAIKCHNEKKLEKLEFVRALKVIGYYDNILYLMTLEVKVISSDTIKIYQAKVRNDFLYDKMTLYIFRPKRGQN